ncbi:AraC family transcriptional regulator [Solimonas aquatica]|uniref:AraC family transcriptional regulator n=1 Tax=Solimonas aquatica TaxID=489703 RepID=A0A1H9GDR7_9GAMM|nr:AraC family transcriptional regulator [Solimonas aquatica]SEQ48229.1 AraC family transcriptional regulator [Solimonas aquatica]
MNQPSTQSMTVDAAVRVPIADVELVRFHMVGPADNELRADETYWLDMCLTPRPDNARARYRDHWSPNRFQRLGKVFMLPAGEVLQARSDGGISQASLLCHLRPEPIRQWFDGDLQWRGQRLDASLDIADSNVRALLLRLAEELRHPGFAGTTMVELITAQLAIELSRYCRNVHENRDSGGLAAWRLRLIEERLREPREAPSLGELAALCGLSVRQLTRGFRVSQGCSIGEHVAVSRVAQAKQMLSGRQSIKAIAYTLGFASPSAFCYAFRRATGQTPRQYRERSLRVTLQ